MVKPMAAYLPLVWNAGSTPLQPFGLLSSQRAILLGLVLATSGKNVYVRREPEQDTLSPYQKPH